MSGMHTAYELHEHGRLVTCTRYWKCVFKRTFYQLKIVPISRFHGLSNSSLLSIPKRFSGLSITAVTLAGVRNWRPDQWP